MLDREQRGWLRKWHQTLQARVTALRGGGPASLRYLTENKVVALGDSMGQSKERANLGAEVHSQN